MSAQEAFDAQGAVTGVTAERPARLLYLSQVDWRWIKQRPQFLAEGLADHYDVHVAYRRLWRRGSLVDEPSRLSRSSLWRLPFRRLPASAALSRQLEARQIGGLIRRLHPDIIWLTAPGFLGSLPPRAAHGARVVYDCMDEAGAFAFDHERARIEEAERTLFREADLVLASSERLAEKARAEGAGDRLQVVRNAFGGCLLPPARPRPGADQGLVLGYAGTLGPWVDWGAMLTALEKIPDLRIELMGPCEVDPPRHARLEIHAPVPHAEIPRRARAWHAGLIPFRPEHVVLSVDPVKLYEYVNLDLPVVARWYPELDRFGDFVDFYRSETELVACIEALRNRTEPRYPPDARAQFLADNDWSARIDVVIAALQERAASAEDRRRSG